MAETSAAELAAELASRIEAGDAAAEARFVELYSRGLTYMLRRLTRDPALADDLHQETFRIVLTKVRSGELKERGKLHGFLRGTARNLWIAETRKNARRPRSEDLTEVEEQSSPTPDALHRVVLKEDRRAVRRLLDELRSERDRQLLLRFHIAEEPRERICADLGLSRRQFNVAIFRARRRFKELIERTARADGGAG
jgi:RNA polymerase sigma-70 factor (ECF subfamily)